MSPEEYQHYWVLPPQFADLEFQSQVYLWALSKNNVVEYLGLPLFIEEMKAVLVD
jgi:hypothetical protein